jgi:site-specific DNA-cytosine methylase
MIWEFQRSYASHNEGANDSIDFQHVWACEIDPKKQSWIAKNFSPKHIFCSAMEVGAGTGHDILSDSRCEVPPVDLLTAGFSCKDCSGMNIYAESFTERMESSSGTTWETLEGTVQCVERNPPLLVILENVVRFGLKGGCQAAARILGSDKSGVFAPGSRLIMTEHLQTIVSRL